MIARLVLVHIHSIHIHSIHILVHIHSIHIHISICICICICCIQHCIILLLFLVLVLALVLALHVNNSVVKSDGIETMEENRGTLDRQWKESMAMSCIIITTIINNSMIITTIITTIINNSMNKIKIFGNTKDWQNSFTPTFVCEEETRSIYFLEKGENY